LRFLNEWKFVLKEKDILNRLQIVHYYLKAKLGSGGEEGLKENRK
jgi:hypothetical protein